MAIRAAHWHSNDTGGPPPIRHRHEAASQTWEPGMAVIDNGSGYLSIWTADAGDIEGLALAPGQNLSSAGTDAAGNQKAAYIKVHPGTRIEISLDDGTGTYALAATDVGQQYGLAISNGILYADQTETTNNRIRVDDLIDPIGTAAGRVAAYVLFDATDYTDAQS